MRSEHFADLDLGSMGYGALSGSGVESHQKLRSKTKKDGVEIALNCDACGMPSLMTITWPEAIVISAGKLPPGWRYTEGYLQPDIGCKQCRTQVPVGVTPEEAKRWVVSGVQARFVDGQQADALYQQATRGGVR